MAVDSVFDSINRGLGTSGRAGRVRFNGSAEDTLAQVYRAEWQDYLDRFSIYEDRAIAFATNPEEVTQAVSRAEENVGQSFATSREALARDRSRYGLSNTAREATSEGRALDRAEASSKIAAMNGTRLHVQDRQQQVMAGGGSVGLREQLATGGN